MVTAPGFQRALDEPGGEGPDPQILDLIFRGAIFVAGQQLSGIARVLCPVFDRPSIERGLGPALLLLLLLLLSSWQRSDAKKRIHMSQSG